MVKLEENDYAYLQSAIDHSLKEILHDEITDFISNPPRNGNSLFSIYSPGLEYLPLPMVHTCDL